LASRAESAGKNIAALAMAAPTENPYYLPLTIHMVHDETGFLGGLAPGRLEALVENLNRMWQPVGIQFFIYGEIDHSIRDINLFDATTREKQDALLRVNVVPNTINVYIANLVTKCGRGTIPSDKAQGVLLDVNCAGGSPGVGFELFAHEMGHYFDLLHTHETQVGGVECPNGSNCSTAGDLVCDTPADPDLGSPVKLDVNCVYDNSVPPPANCGNTPYNPLTNNLMSEGRNACKRQFTAGQINRILNALHNKGNRKNLINSGTRYVDRLASPSNTQCTYTAPCRTVDKAIQAARDGDGIFIKWGGYWAPSGIVGKRLTLGKWGFEPNTGVVLVP
jgi:hypothetical protein